MFKFLDIRPRTIRWRYWLAYKLGWKWLRPKFKKVTLPFVRKPFPVISKKLLVSIQPMSGPSGLVFEMDFNSETSGSGGIAGPGGCCQ